jgi:hypothetical protein
MRVRTATWLAWSVCALSWMLTALGASAPPAAPSIRLGGSSAQKASSRGPTKAAAPDKAHTQ